MEIKAPGSPEGPHGYTDLLEVMAGQWREHLALILCYLTIGAYWLQHHYSGRIYDRSDHGFSCLNLLFLLAIVSIPYPIRVWCFHLGTRFEPAASISLVVGLALTACTWMAKWYYALPGRRVMDERLAPDFVRQMTRRYGIATLIQLATIPLATVAPPGRCGRRPHLRGLLPAAPTQAPLQTGRGAERRRKAERIAGA